MKENVINNIINEDRCYCVYMHTSPSNKVYIGVTCQNPPEKRWANGLGYPDNKHFKAAILKYKWCNFKHEILLTGLTKEEAIKKETELIAQYNATDRNCGYNVALGGNSVGKLPEERRRRISEAGKIPVLQYTMSFEFIRRWDGAIDASDELGIAASSIAACCRNKAGSAGNFIWRYESPESVKENPKGHTNPDTYKPVDQYSMNGEFIASYIHITEASFRTGVSSSAITKCCNDERRYSGGFIWRWYGIELTESRIAWCFTTGREDARKPIIQYSVNGEFIKYWDMIDSVNKELGYDVSAIIRCCKGDQRTSYGFIWCYANEELTEEHIKWCNSHDKKRKVIQYSLDGEFIRIHDSLADACKFIGRGTPSSLAACCRNRRNQGYGYIWRYFDDISDPYAPLFSASASPVPPTLSEAM